MGCAVVGHPDVGVRLVHRVELDLLDSRCRSQREIDERSVNREVVLLDGLPGGRVEFFEEPKPGLYLRFCRDRSPRRGERSRGERPGKEVVELRYDPGVIDEVKPVLAAADAQLLDRERRALREDQVRQVPELLDRDYAGITDRVGFVEGRCAGIIDRFGLVEGRRPGILSPPHAAEDTEGCRRGSGLFRHRRWRGCSLFSHPAPLYPVKERPDRILPVGRTPIPGMPGSGENAGILALWRRYRGKRRRIIGLAGIRVRFAPDLHLIGPRCRNSALRLRQGISVAGTRAPGLCKKIPDCCYQSKFFILMCSHPLCPQYQQTFQPVAHGTR
ncbi:hypothetical protein DSECCO2_618910 [anaerobic digester metagenome]